MRKAIEVFCQNDGEVTKAYYAAMDAIGPLGKIATALFRAQKRSSRAKEYRGRRFREASYGVKGWSISQLCGLLNEHASTLNIAYGWKQDPAVILRGQASWVLYVDLPQGQVSFHNPERMAGPDYSGEWDGTHKSCERCIAFCDFVANGAQA
jgi:hypothetical protein